VPQSSDIPVSKTVVMALVSMGNYMFDDSAMRALKNDL
jgi:hypothetical protein